MGKYRLLGSNDWRDEVPEYAQRALWRMRFLLCLAVLAVVTIIAMIIIANLSMVP